MSVRQCCKVMVFLVLVSVGKLRAQEPPQRADQKE